MSPPRGGAEAEGDRHRPRFHLTAPAGWINDPVGALRRAGRYHLFYQHNPHGTQWARPHWGHVDSRDLVHWRHLPEALAPDADGADADGCFSGSGVVTEEGAALLYTGVRGAVGPGQWQATCLATSTDPGLRDWAKAAGNPVTPPPRGLRLTGFRDPFVWWAEDGWHQLVGSGIVGRGGALLHFRSPDLRHWEDLGAALVGEGEHVAGEWAGRMWECPSLLQGPDGALALVSVHDGDMTTHHTIGIVGDFDGATLRPERARRLDLGPDWYAPCVLDDDGRWLVWGWSQEARGPAGPARAGWSGTLTPARVLTLADGWPRLDPLPELARLRQRRLPVDGSSVEGSWRAATAGDALDIELTLTGGGEAAALRLLASPDGEEATTVTIDRAAGRLELDRRRSSRAEDVTADVVTAPLVATEGPLAVRVLVDRSIVEVFAGAQPLTARVYPVRADSQGLEVTASPATRASLVVHTMGGATPPA